MNVLFKLTFGPSVFRILEWHFFDICHVFFVSSIHMNFSIFYRWSDLLNTVRSILPAKSWNSLSPDLYATFWGLTLYDLHFPKDRYDTEIKKLHDSLKQLEDNSDNSSVAISRRKKDKERIQDLLDKLNSESQKHQQHIASVLQRLVREKDKWLSSSPDALKINMEFLQRCIYPRCVFSMQDAVYCATFVQTLHSLGTPFFNTVNHIDALICKTLQPMVCCCTEFEAGRLGRFLHDTLKMAYYWKVLFFSYVLLHIVYGYKWK
jgi:THO complex subunit 2